MGLRLLLLQHLPDVQLIARNVQPERVVRQRRDVPDVTAVRGDQGPWTQSGVIRAIVLDGGLQLRRTTSGGAQTACLVQSCCLAAASVVGWPFQLANNPRALIIMARMEAAGRHIDTETETEAEIDRDDQNLENTETSARQGSDTTRTRQWQGSDRLIDSDTTRKR